jgi:pseudaminic acid synthase
MWLTRTFIVANIASNQCGTLEEAMSLVTSARECGADAVAFPCYEPDVIAHDCGRREFVFDDGPRKGQKIYDFYRDGVIPQDWLPNLFRHIRNVDLVPIANIFDIKAIPPLEKLFCPIYSISSHHAHDIHLIECAAATGKPIMIGTDGSSIALLDHIRAIINRYDLSTNSAVLYTPSELSCEMPNLWALDVLSQFMGFPVGISDPTPSVLLPALAVMKRVTVVEKYFTIAHGHRPIGTTSSLDPYEFKKMVSNVKSAAVALQEPKSILRETPIKTMRSLYAVEDIAAGQKITSNNVKSVRIHGGMDPKKFPEIIGSIAQVTIKRGSPISQELVAFQKNFERCATVLKARRQGLSQPRIAELLGISTSWTRQLELKAIHEIVSGTELKALAPLTDREHQIAARAGFIHSE